MRERGLTAVWRSDYAAQVLSGLCGVPSRECDRSGWRQWPLPALAAKAATKAIPTCATNAYPLPAGVVDSSRVIKLGVEDDHATIRNTTSAFCKAYPLVTSH